MGFHHVALATADMPATHAFYTEAMGFTLAKVQAAPTPEGGWAKHLFYDTGSAGMIAFWELHDETMPEVDGAMSRAVGLPEWVNHMAFHAVDDDHYESSRERWLSLGADVMEIDHGFVRSIYTMDPNGTMVEWCQDLRVLDESDHAEAISLLNDPEPELTVPPEPVFHRGDRSVTPPWKSPAPAGQ